MRKGLFTLDPRAAQIPVGQNRKRGRPKNTTSALLFQSNEAVDQTEETTSVTTRRGKTKRK